MLCAEHHRRALHRTFSTELRTMLQHAMHVIAMTHEIVLCMSLIDQCLMSKNLLSLDGSYSDPIATKRFHCPIQLMSLVALKNHAAETSNIKQTP